MGFGNYFMHWIELIDASQSAEVWIEGQKSGKINITRGVRQGRPLSPLLFNITIEMLALTIRPSQLCTGLKILSKEHKIMLYVDDVVFVMTHPDKSLRVLKEIIYRYGMRSGYKIKKLKSTIFGINVDEAIKKEIQTFDSIPWKKKVKYLGVIINLPLTNEGLVQSNLDPMMQHLGQLLEKLCHLKLSWFEKIAAVKMKVLSRFLFLFRALVWRLTKQEVRQIQKKLENFVQGGKKSRFESSILQQSKEHFPI